MKFDIKYKNETLTIGDNKDKDIWNRINELEKLAIEAYLDRTEWGFYLEALCNSDLEAYKELMLLYKKFNHESYWRK